MNANCLHDETRSLGKVVLRGNRLVQQFGSAASGTQSQ
jgi:hypothetical protein